MEIRNEKKGLSKNLIHIGFRFLALFAIGFLIVYADGGELFSFKESYGITVMNWDVVISIATAYLLTVPFLFIKDLRIRLGASLGWVALYQILLLTTNLRTYAIASAHGGVFGTVFGYTAICALATCLGEYLYFDSADEARNDKKYMYMLILGIILLIVSFFLALIPGMEAVKRQVSFTYIGISARVTIIIIYLFVFFDRKLNWELKYLRAFGLNPFLIYFIAEIPSFLIELAMEELEIPYNIWGQLAVTVVLLAITSAVALITYKKKKVFATEKMAVIGFVILLALAIALIAGGIL